MDAPESKENLAGLGITLREDEEVVVQDAQMEAMSLDELSEAINQGVSALDELTASRETLVSVQESASLGRQLTVLSTARSLTDRLSRKYGRVVSVNEHALSASSGTVMAIESAIEDNDNFFMRILNAILNMAKWFWRKLMGLFGQSQDPEETSKKVSDTVKSIEKKTNGKDRFFVEAADTLYIGNAFGFLGPKIEMPALENLLKSMIPMLDSLYGVTEHALFAYDDLIKAMSKPNTTDAELVASLKAIQKHISGGFARFEKATAFDFFSVGRNHDHSESAKTQYYKAGPFSHNKYFVAAVVQLDSGVCTYKSNFGPIAANTTVSIADMSVDGLLRVEAMHHKLSKSIKTISEKLKRAFDKALSKESQLKASIEKLASKPGVSRESIALVNSTWLSISDVIKTSFHAFGSVTYTAADVYKVLKVVERHLKEESK